MLSPHEVCIQYVLHDNGYENVYIGKWHLDASQMNGIPFPKEDERARHYDALIGKHKKELLDPFSFVIISLWRRLNRE